MRAKDIMTPYAITVGPEAKVAEIAKLMLERRISAVPVVDEGMRVLGIISEGDLIRRHEIGTGEARRSWWLNFFAEPDRLARQYTKSHAAKARDIMSTPAITVDENASVNEIAETLEKNHIKRVPVVRGTRLLGIVSRANVVQMIASAKRIEIPYAAGDETIRRHVREAVEKQPWGNLGTTNVTVNDGLVEFWGTVGSEAERTAFRVAAESIAGVKAVKDHRAVRPSGPTNGL
jgi:CBS domain-containing protein